MIPKPPHEQQRVLEMNALLARQKLVETEKNPTKVAETRHVPDDHETFIKMPQSACGIPKTSFDTIRTRNCCF